VTDLACKKKNTISNGLSVAKSYRHMDPLSLTVH